MANEEHLAILLQGIEVWNQWRLNNRLICPNLSGTDELYGKDLHRAILSEANLGAADLRKADLSRAALSGTHLLGSDLSNANLSETYLHDANLNGAILRGAIFRRANISATNLFRSDFSGADLRNTDLSQANLNLANFSGANLSNTNLTRAELGETDFSNANLTGAQLSCVEASDTNFAGANLTGACIDNWHIGKNTNFKDVICDYIYFEDDWKKQRFADRRPHDCHRNFAPGEFEKVIHVSSELIPLFFREGINWKAFIASFYKIRVKDEQAEIGIKGIEDTGDGILIKVRTTEKADKGAIDGNFWQGYEFAKKQLQESYETRLSDKESEINRLFYLIQKKDRQLLEIAKIPKYDQRNSNLLGGIADTNYGTMVETQNNSQGDLYNQSGNIGIGHNEGTIQDDATIGGTIEEEKQ